MQVDLPDGATAELIEHDEITERIFRPIDKAKTKVSNMSARLLQKGYDPPETWPKELQVEIGEDEKPLWGDTSKEDQERILEDIRGRNLKNIELATEMSDEDQDAMNDLQMALVLGITKSWSYESEIAEDSVLDLKKNVLEFLAKSCSDVFENTGVDLGVEPNPKVLGSNLEN